MDMIAVVICYVQGRAERWEDIIPVAGLLGT